MTAKIVEEPTYRERTLVFQDRLHAGRLLANQLREHTDKENVVLLALPAGGVPVGYVVAKELAVAMDVMIVRKIQIPWNTEAGFGAITWDGETVLNKTLIRQLGLAKVEIGESISQTRKIIQERLRMFRKGKPMPDMKDKVVILVDDGVASGFTMLAAARSARKRKPQKIIIAVPTASMGAINLLAPEVDEIVCLNIRSGPVFAVADAYEKWYDISDEEVIKTLESG
ncbi:MAG TPA: phosphoribosyltransferase family protein [Candidatus Bathyarchaeia archaeon]